MEFVIQFDVPITNLLGIVNDTAQQGLIYVIGRDRFTVRAVYRAGKLIKFIAFKSWSIVDIKKMWQVERKLKRANIDFNVRQVK
ncbi:MAG: hypothetical protein ACRC6V_03160 [Bacteroidales bacterium]